MVVLDRGREFKVALTTEPQLKFKKEIIGFVNIKSPLHNQIIINI